MILGPEATLAQAQREWSWLTCQVVRPAKRINKYARPFIVYNRASPLVSIPQRTHLRREAHAAREVLKVRVGAIAMVSCPTLCRSRWTMRVIRRPHHDALGTRNLSDPSRGTNSASRSRGKL